MVEKTMRCTKALVFIICGIGILYGQKDPDAATVVAEFGKHRITLKEFRIAYLQLLKNPRTFDSKELRRQFLDELIQRCILSKEAERLGFAKSEILTNEVEAFRDKALRTQHFEKVIKPKFTIHEDEIEEAYMFTQESRKIKHLFYKTKEQADSAYSALSCGASFDSLAHICFKDSTLANSGGDLGWVEWDQLEYDMAKAAFRQPVNMISEPIKSSFGYHLIEVTDFKKKPLITRYEYLVHKRKVKHLLEFKLGDKYGFEYVGAMMSKLHLAYNTDVMEFVKNKLKDLFKRKPSALDQTSEYQLFDSEIQKVEMSLWDARNEVMATVNGKNITVGMFIGDLIYIPYNALYKSFKWTFEYVLRDFFLTQEATALGLDKNEDVLIRTNLFRNYSLQLAYRREIVRHVTVEEKEIKAYYDSHKKECNGATYDQMKETFWNLVLTEKKQKVIPDLVKMLTHGMVIKKNIKAIDDYYEGVKKGDIQQVGY
jgi:hypothetical protein